MRCQTRLSRLTVAIALLASGATAGNLGAAEPPYPIRPIRLVIASAAGGGLDLTARAISPKLSDAMGQSWIVDARGGAAGNLGAEIVARANPDGYTVLLSTSTQLTVNPSLYRMSFSVEKDLQPITMVVTADHVLVVHPAVPAKTFKEFIALAKQKPGTLNFASANVGSSSHLGAELLKKRTAIDIVNVPYKGGGPAAAAVLAGETQALVGTVASTITYISSGRLRALAAAGGARSRLLPDLPTVAESGYPGFEANVWYALSVPAATSGQISGRIRSETLKALQQPDVQSVLARQGLVPVTSTSAELAARIRTETRVWADVIKDAGIRVE